MTGKWKTTITVWSDFDPSSTELSRLAQEAETGAAICTEYEVSFIADPNTDPEFSYTGEFFNDNEEEA